MKSSYRWLISLFALLFVSLQTGAIVHAASYADSPHEHNGMVCDIGTIAADTQCVLPSPPVQPRVQIAHKDAFTAAYTSAPCVTPPGRAPPPRSPPALF